MTRDPVQVVLDYHQATMHHPHRYARGPGFMDWDTQPDPFLRFDGAPLHDLPLRPVAESVKYEASFLEGQLPAAPITRASIAQLLQDSLGLSAWKQAGEARWALRVNPSSGNLHPTEGYLLAGAIEGLHDAPAVYHYAVHAHALERRRALPDALPPGCVLIGLSSIPLRESWKYGERAFRYCQHDVGHAIAAVSIAAAGLGWRCRLLEGVPDGELATLLGLDRRGPEAEHPDALLLIGGDPRPWDPAALYGAAPLLGSPLPLATGHEHWRLIDGVIAATTGTLARPASARIASPCLDASDSPHHLRPLIHQRRSAVDMDGRTGITAGAFFQILARLLPGAGAVPLSTLTAEPLIELALFVHRVQGVTPGLYLLSRNPARLDALKSAMAADFEWSAVEGCPEGLPLLRLRAGDCRGIAASLSCGQAIAGDGCFSVAMLAWFAPVLAAAGPVLYRQLHWEAGLLGQVLYLEAEATGVRGTGIGCFFDADTHRFLGITDETLRDLYHFTLGGPVEDDRLQTLPPYDHLTPGR